MKDSRYTKTEDYKIGDVFYIFSNRKKLEYNICTVTNILIRVRTSKIMYSFRNKKGFLSHDSIWVKNLNPFYKEGEVETVLTSLTSVNNRVYYDTKIQILKDADKMINRCERVGSTNIINEIKSSKKSHPEFWC